MTDKELVEFVFDGLIKQGGCSVDNYKNCMYRSPDGRKCAAGLLIKDEDYKDYFENSPCHPKGFSTNQNVSHEISKLLTSYGLDSLKVQRLQEFHDAISSYDENNQVTILKDAKEYILLALSNNIPLSEVNINKFY